MTQPTIPTSQQAASSAPSSANGLHSFIDKVSANVEATDDAIPRESGASSAISNAIKSKIAHAAAMAKKSPAMQTKPSGMQGVAVASPSDN